MLKILFLAANPLNTEPLRLDEEVRSIDAALRQTEFRDQIDLRSHWAVRLRDLQGLFLRHKPDVVHFSGHGSNDSEIILQDDAGRGIIVSADALSDLFGIFKDQIHCVLLNACFSAEQAGAIGKHIDVVIGMSDAITDQAAQQFSTAFYQGIGYGLDVLTAFNLGCNHLDLSNIDESHIPQLLGKSDPAAIHFDLNKAKKGIGTKVSKFVVNPSSSVPSAPTTSNQGGQEITQTLERMASHFEINESDPTQYINSLIEKLEAIIPEHIEVHRKGGFFSKRSTVIIIHLAECQYVFRMQNRLSIQRLHIVKGVVLQKEGVPIGNWPTRFVHDLATSGYLLK